MISVIIPMYNAESRITKTLNSVKKQNYPKGKFEIIIVNDGSTDQSKAMVEDYIEQNTELWIHLINQENSGVSKARNAALKIAKGDYIALLDADDEWLAEKTQKQMEYLESKNCDIDFLATARNNSKILFPYSVKNKLAKITFQKLLIRNEAQPSTVIFKRKILDNTGYFDDQQRYAEDVNYWMRISLQNKMYILDESLVLAGDGKRTFGVSGLSANLQEMEKGFQKNLQEMYSLHKINFFQYFLLNIFYKSKYLLLVFRTFYNKKMETSFNLFSS